MDKRIYLCLAHMSGKEMGFIQEAFDTNWVVSARPECECLRAGFGTLRRDRIKRWWP